MIGMEYGVAIFYDSRINKGYTMIEWQFNRESDKSESSIMQSLLDMERWEPWFTIEGLPVSVGRKVEKLVNVLNSSVVDMEALRKHLSAGIPDEARLIREYCWKLVLDYLPPQRALWREREQKQSETYHGLLRMFLPQSKFEDYPLLLRRDHARFIELQSDFLLWEQIEKDTSRTHAQFSFFSTECKTMMIPYLTSARREKFRQIYGEDEEKYRLFMTEKTWQRRCYRYDYMTRILYVYARLNPRIQYVQGMNEILAPIFYLANVGKNDIDESACFFMLNNAISDIIELHIKDLDKSENGIHGKLQQVNNMLVVLQPVLWSRLELLKIDPFFYCFRWITLLFAQDFPLFDTFRIWESIFSAHSRLEFIYCFALALMTAAKPAILTQEFTAILQYLQNIKDHVQLEQIICNAHNLAHTYREYDFKTAAANSKRAINNKPPKKKKGLLNTINGFLDKML